MSMQHWERYQQIKTLGCGSYGTVHLCKDLDPSSEFFEDLVAIKTVSLAAITDQESKLAMSEVAILRNLNHPNVLKFIDCFIDDEQQLCCVTEYVDGGDLTGIIKSSKSKKRYLDPFIVVDIVRQVLEGLAYLHSQSVIHRDIKPANIYITVSGTVKIGDFGVSKLVSDVAPHAVTFIGTPFYVCPELCMGEKYSFGADIWALGVMTYELYCLKLPFFASNVLALVNIVSEGKYDRELLHNRPLTQDQKSEVLMSSGEDYLMKMEGLGSLVGCLVEAMLVNDPQDRPTAQQLLLEYFGLTSLPPLEEEMRGSREDFGDHNSYAEIVDDEVFLGSNVFLKHAAVLNSVELFEDEATLCRGESQVEGGDGDDVMLGTRQDSTVSLSEEHVLVIGGGGTAADRPTTSTSTSSPAARRLSRNGVEELTVDSTQFGDSQQPQPSAGSTLSQPPTGWAHNTKFHNNPAALEDILKQRALVFHRKRHEKLKQLREKEKNTPKPTPLEGPPRFSAFLPLYGGVRPTAEMRRDGGETKLVATSPSKRLKSTLQNTPAFMQTVREVAQRILEHSDQQSTKPPGALPYDPPRIHFEDDDEEEKSDVKLKVELLVCSTGASLPIKGIRSNTSLKKFVRKIKKALLEAKERDPSSVPEFLEEDDLEEMEAEQLMLAYVDKDGDFVSFSTHKEWKHITQDHMVRCGTPVAIKIRTSM